MSAPGLRSRSFVCAAASSESESESASGAEARYGAESGDTSVVKS